MYQSDKCKGCDRARSFALADVDGFIPYLLERWPGGGRPHHVELLQGDGQPPPEGVDGWLVFRVSASEPERDPDARPIDWDRVLETRRVDDEQ